MPLVVTHTFVSAVPDSSSVSLVRPSDWNSNHTLTGTLDVSQGGTGATTSETALAALDGLSAAAEDQDITGGARITSKDLGTVSSGTLTPDPGDRPMQHYTNTGAHALAPGTNAGAYFLDILNSASAGAITPTGWDAVAGDAFTTTSGDKFRCACSIGENGSLLVVQAMQ